MGEAYLNGLAVYRVGGSVRDELLELPVRERDWVVVGATPEEMLARGFRAVGKDFPVFLHPESGEEYALARTERKTGRGYHGFVVHASPEVTLEADLARRDLTINAMARAPDGTLIDPYGGLRDLKARVLRHVSPAFVEDPVRLLRLARFAARFAPLGFTVAEETRRLLRQMVASGEVDALVPERVWAETEKALACERPSVFFRVLRESGALGRVFPELDALFGVPQRMIHHPEVDCGVHTLWVVDRAAALEGTVEARFAALVHDLGKAHTDPAAWPRHHGHESLGLAPLAELAGRLRIPRAHRRLAERVIRYHGQAHRVFELRPATLLELLSAVDAWRRPALLEDFLLACQADFQGRPGWWDRAYPQGDHLHRAAEVAAAVQGRKLAAEGLRGAALGEALRRRRLAVLARLQKQHQQHQPQ